MGREIEGYRENIADLNEAFPNQRWLNQSEVARYLGVDRMTVRRMIERGKIVAYNIGVGKYKIYRIDKLDLAKSLARGQKNGKNAQ